MKSHAVNRKQMPFVSKFGIIELIKKNNLKKLKWQTQSAIQF